MQPSGGGERAWKGWAPPKATSKIDRLLRGLTYVGASGGQPIFLGLPWRVGHLFAPTTLARSPAMEFAQFKHDVHPYLVLRHQSIIVPYLRWVPSCFFGKPPVTPSNSCSKTFSALLRPPILRTFPTVPLRFLRPSSQEQYLAMTFEARSAGRGEVRVGWHPRPGQM